MFLAFILVESEDFTKSLNRFSDEVCFETVDKLHVQKVRLNFLHLNFEWFCIIPKDKQIL